MKTILAEKPSVAQSIAACVGAKTRRDGYMEGNGYFVTWAIGHLVGLAMPEAYGYENWSLDHLPILPEKFKLEVTNDPGIKKQFKVIQSLYRLSHEIIVATDAGREGELIFRYIHQMAEPPSHVVVKRLWISDLLLPTIEKGLKELHPASDYDRLYYAAKARSEADWLVGINFTQGLTLVSGKRTALSIGRVQTPTLRLIVDRYNENKQFSSVPFYVPKITLQDPQNEFVLTCDDKFEQKELAEKILLGLKGKQSPPIFREDVLGKEEPPLPYDLTTLQRTANKVFKYTAQQTLDAVQSLYEKHRAVTYPRTDSQHLSSAQKKEIPTVFKNLQQFTIQGVDTDTLKESCLANIEGSAAFNDAKVTDHHAIIPTGANVEMDALGLLEKNVFLLIVQRFFQSFLPECLKTTRKLSCLVADHVFSASSVKVTQKGWRVLSPESPDERHLPETKVEETRMIVDAIVHEGFTKPKPLFTEGSLLGVMETAGQLVSDKKIREGLKDRGLGTPATRASVIETLIKRGYIIRDKAKLLPTELGLGLIESIGSLSIASPELTGDWEFKLKQIERSELLYDDFMREINTYVVSTFPQIISSGKKVATIQTPGEATKDFSYGKCPKCETGLVRKGKKAAYCSNWNQDPKCDFSIWFDCFGKKLTEAIIRSLVEKGSTNNLKGFKSKAGKPFEAKLVLDENKKVKLSFD